MRSRHTPAAAAVAAVVIGLATITGCTTTPAPAPAYASGVAVGVIPRNHPGPPGAPATAGFTTQAGVAPTGPPAPPNAASESVATTAAAGPPGPLQVAVDWLTAYRASSWRQPATAWITAVAPYVTGPMNDANRQLAQAQPGASWAEFVARRCTTTVVQPGAVIPPEAPATDRVVHVQVAGTLHTTCQTGPPSPDEAAAATLTVIDTPLGWRVAAREQ